MRTSFVTDASIYTSLDPGSLFATISWPPPLRSHPERGSDKGVEPRRRPKIVIVHRRSPLDYGTTFLGGSRQLSLPVQL